MKDYNINVKSRSRFKGSQLWYLKLQLLYSRYINTAGFRMMKTFDLFEHSVEIKVVFLFVLVL